MLELKQIFYSPGYSLSYTCKRAFRCTMNDFSALILAINYSISVIMNYINVFLA